MATLTDEQVTLWIVLLKDVPFDVAQRRMSEHIMGNKFPPTIAEIASHERPDDPAKLLKETEKRLAALDFADQLAIDCPPHLLPRYLRDGVGD
jgi:hypothetical protein